ncbi:MAG: T9SS type A sorting domain-containing protein [Bacteroidetes bacterium]|nr:T9SS type A sorting domain-containing protein [Bacteroidota bacterium]
MKRFNFIFCMMLIAGFSFGQNKAVIQKENETSVSKGAYLMDAGPLLEKFYKANGIDLVQLAKSQPVLKKTTGPWNFNIGDTHNWWAQDLQSNAFYSVPSTCRAVGTHCYVFVEDSSWTNGRVDSNAVAQIVNAFDNTTPANANKGVYQTDVDTFGNPPDVDNDPKIIIFILNIKDGFSGTGGYTAGYFTGYNELNYTNSNLAELYYMDCYPMNLNSADSHYNINTAMQITAHEFQHMIQWNYHQANPNKIFFNEGCSMIAEVVCGYPLRLQSYYTNATNVQMLEWKLNPPGEVLSDYARAARFFLYIKEQFGVSALTKFVQSNLTNINAFDISVFPALGSSRRFKDVVVDWYIANYLNDTSVDQKWGYQYAGLGHAASTPMANPNVTNYKGNVYKLGAQYFSYTMGSNLNMNFALNGNTGITVKAIKSGTGGKQVMDGTMMGNNMMFSVPDFGTSFSNVTFLVCQNDYTYYPDSNSYHYNFTSTGTFQKQTLELAYDSTEPVGYVSQTVGDSIAVQFDAVSGGKLDSIRVAIRNLVPIDGRILESVGNATRLGGKNYANITAISKLTVAPDVIDPTGTYPYPQPYPNWTTIDVSSYNISTDKSFVVEFPFLGTSTSVNKVLSTYMPSTGTEHTIFYSLSSNKWAYYGVSGHTNYSWVALIRAYVTVGGATDVKQIVELKPASFRLEQNYPNPFNPSTNISYQLPKGSHVTLKIYDMLGRDVATLVDEYQNAGAHNSQFSILNSQLSSGVYFYRLVAVDPSQGSGQSFVQTKKMILMK